MPSHCPSELAQHAFEDDPRLARERRSDPLRRAADGDSERSARAGLKPRDVAGFTPAAQHDGTGDGPGAACERLSPVKIADLARQMIRVAIDADGRKLTIALGLILSFMLLEVVVGIVAHSLALISDAAHMLSDAAALGLSIIAIRLAARPARGAMTYGLKRVEILSAQANGVTLLVLALLILVEACRRLLDPPTVQGGTVTIVALVGIAVNVVAVAVLAQANRERLSVEGSFQHLLTDPRVGRGHQQRHDDE